ncbi:MAG TPA: translation initiation factor IF-2 [Patescibacteria group bacterium]|nr:translation initiation factor IF-2 [Patescibacteria group bacterium]
MAKKKLSVRKKVPVTSPTPVKQASSTSSEVSAPVVTVLGHVDHGKTTLLDAIRKTNIATREHGGITQKIGASQVEIVHEGQKRKITFIDTPGHEAFMQMRGRGVKVADIGLLVVSLVDGVMPQTKESIKILKTANIPYIVVLTKSDVPDKNAEKVKGQLLKEEVLLEGQGGDVPVIEVSAKTNQNIKELLDLILLVQDMHPLPVGDKFKGIVIESRLDTKAGPRATVIVKSGKLSLRDEIISGEVNGRVRTLINGNAEQLKEAITGDGVEVLGFEKVPTVGSIVHKKGEEVEKEEDSKASVEAFRKGSEDLLRVVIVADSYGSLEAITNAVEEKINIVSKKTGEVTPADLMFAKSTGAIILGFNAKISPSLEKTAREEKILIRNYPLIYEMIAEIEDFLEGKRLSLEEKIFGRAKILASFPFDKQKVIGIAVLEGRVAKGDRVRIERDDISVGEGTIASVRQGKDQISKIEAGAEAGVLLANDLDFQVGDMLISHG